MRVYIRRDPQISDSLVQFSLKRNITKTYWMDIATCVCVNATRRLLKGSGAKLPKGDEVICVDLTAKAVGGKG